MRSILLIGLGKFGTHIAEKLDALNQQVMAVDSNEEKVQSALKYVTNAQIGDSTNREFLASLGIRNFDACIVTIGDSFQNSLETTSLLKELGAKKVISRAATDIQEKFLLRNGADQVIFPEKQLAAWIAIRCSSDSILDYIEIDDDYSIYEITTPKKWVGMTVLDIGVRKKYGINILGLRKDGKLEMCITPETRLSADKSILMLCPNESFHKLPI